MVDEVKSNDLVKDMAKPCYGKMFLAGDLTCKCCEAYQECQKQYKINFTHTCYVCSKKGMGYQYIGTRKGIKLYRCTGAWCQFNVIKGIDKTKINEQGFIPQENKTPVSPNGQKVPYVSKFDIIFKALQEKPKTMGELVEAVQSSPMSIRAQFSFIRSKKGYEVIDNMGTYELQKIVLSEEQKVELEKPKEVIKIVDKNSLPLTYKALDIYNLLKQDMYTLEELATKTGTAVSTVKNYVTYMFKNRGYAVKAISFPGRGIVYKID